MGGLKNNTEDYAGMAVLSQDRTKWIEIELELPYEASNSGATYLNGEIYLFGGLNNPKALYKLDKNLKWIRLADMNVGRGRIQNSGLEGNGDIWVFGGVNGNYDPLKSVERYDPKENKWTLMADMKETRSNAAAAVWNNKIIICGGWVEFFTITNSAECYNPEDNSWIEFTHLPTTLWGHSLVTYENKFILFGGNINGEATNAVWELDLQESNSKWNPLPPMKYPSAYFPGIILDQEIYAIGGVRVIGLDLSRNILSRVEIFDGERWRDGAALPYNWSFMSSLIIPQTLADRLSQYKKESETILIMGGLKNNGNGFAGMAVLSQNRTKWIEIELELPYKASTSGAIYLNGEIYLFGGVNNPKALYKLGKNLKWIRLADMNVGRGGIENSCLEWNGYIWVFGGRDPENTEYLKSVERYDPKENKWTLMADMKEARVHAAAAVWNNKIIICGGWNEDYTLTDTAECYNPEDNSWIEFTHLPKPLAGHSLVTYEYKLILFGGYSGGEVKKAVWELEPQESNPTWKPLKPMNYRSYHFAGKIVDQEIYAIGGRQKFGFEEDFYLRGVEIFDGKRWRDGAALPYSWAGMPSVIIPQTLADRLSQYKKE